MASLLQVKKQIASIFCLCFLAALTMAQCVVLPAYDSNLFPDMHYEYQVLKLNRKTPVVLEFNHQVKRYIEFFATRRKPEFEKFISLSHYYFPVFEEHLNKYNLPLELKYIPVIESGLNPLAKSKSGAVGLWQFKYNSAKLFGLQIDSYVDQRADMFASTEAACKYLQYLHSTYNDWQLVIASFNGGPGEVRNAVARAGGTTDFWELQPYMATQTQNYLPQFIAAMYVFEYYKELGLNPPSIKFSAHNCDTVHVTNSVTMAQLSAQLSMPIDELKYLNPVYVADIIPESEHGLPLVLPKNKIEAFLERENRIYGILDRKPDYHEIQNKLASTDNKRQIAHVVEKGEYFHQIALRYSCSVESLKKWNNMDTNMLHPGQKLIIWVDDNQTGTW
ncbi:MAG: transglycosylase SLT domain-containing protein [Bacteroidales bacterium]|nr:transglycosylase SLT domain-containing protein [Bacteroidales bacterium]